MKLYHGSNVAVKIPQILESDRRLDFGTGFYLTSSYEQAERWAKLTCKRRGNGKQIITVYELDENILSNLKVKRFDKASIEWLQYISANRNLRDFIDDLDIVIGPVAIL